jgi:hypothetical protein
MTCFMLCFRIAWHSPGTLQHINPHEYKPTRTHLRRYANSFIKHHSWTNPHHTRKHKHKNPQNMHNMQTVLYKYNHSCDTITLVISRTVCTSSASPTSVSCKASSLRRNKWEAKDVTVRRGPFFSSDPFQLQI